MKASYTTYIISGRRGPQQIIEKGEIEIPDDGNGILFHLRKAFPGYNINRLTEPGEAIRMHDKAWTVGMIIRFK